MSRYFGIYFLILVVKFQPIYSNFHTDLTRLWAVNGFRIAAFCLGRQILSTCRIALSKSDNDHHPHDTSPPTAQIARLQCFLVWTAYSLAQGPSMTSRPRFMITMMMRFSALSLPNHALRADQSQLEQVYLDLTARYFSHRVSRSVVC